MEILTNVQLFLLCLDGDAVPLTGAEQAIAMELTGGEIEDQVGIEMLTVEASLKMEMGGCGTSCTSRERNRLSCFDPIARLDQILGIMAINRFQSIVMTDHNDIAIGRIGFGHPYEAIKSSYDRIVGFRLNIHTGMVPASASVWRDDLASG